MAGASQAGWYEDPSQRHELRYFDGAGWTEHVLDHGVAASDPPPGSGVTLLDEVVTGDAHDTATRDLRPSARQAALALAAVAVFLAGVLLAGGQHLEWLTGDLHDGAEVARIEADARAAGVTEGREAARGEALQAGLAGDDRYAAGYDDGYDRGFERGYDQGYDDGWYGSDGTFEDEGWASGGEAWGGVAPTGACEGDGQELPLDTVVNGEMTEDGVVYCLTVPETGAYDIVASAAIVDLVMYFWDGDGWEHYSDDEYGSDPALEGLALTPGRYELQLHPFSYWSLGSFEVEWRRAVG